MSDRRQLIETYDDAVFALLMDEHAQLEGEALLAQFQAAVDAELVPQTPQSIHRVCAQAIDRQFRLRRVRETVKSLFKGIIRVFLVVFLVLAWLGKLAAEAWRESRVRKELLPATPKPGDPAEPPEETHPIFLTI